MKTSKYDDFKKERRPALENLFSMIDTAGVNLIFKPNIHQKFAIIDKKSPGMAVSIF
jgi:hypothetical protein